jgi:hypothetical protein
MKAGSHKFFFTTAAVPDRSKLPASPLPTNSAPFVLK